VINRHFQLRTCTDHVLNSRTRPCILYQIKRCPAPCVYPIDAKEYGEQVEDASLFLAGSNDELLPRLRGRMKDHAGRMEYERAAQIRDQLHAVEKTLTAQTVVSTDLLDQDVVGVHREGDVVEVAVLFMRLGKLLGRRMFSLREQEVPDPDVVREFVLRYYELGTFVPDEVLLPVAIEDVDAIADKLTELRGKRVQVIAPQRGPRAKLLALAAKNATAGFAARKDKRADSQLALEKLQKRLGLKRYPRRIECFDIAHIQGAATVASMVVFEDGEPQKPKYRTFKVKTVTNDDFASMYEVISRRFRRARDKKPGWEEPDLLILDGGKGQLSTALAALKDVGADLSADRGFDVIALAKERTDVQGDELPDRVYLRNIKDALQLRANSTELFLLARVRDEAHRFANQFHRKLRKKRTLRSSLADVPGVGTKRQRGLLRHFGSVKKIRAASVEDIAKAPGMNRTAAEAVKRFLGETTS
jgi:excinuclease ABC subunit C